MITYAPASIPLTDLAKLQLPSPQGMNFQAVKIVTPPAPQASNVETTADPIAFPSPSSLIDALVNHKTDKKCKFSNPILEDLE